MDDLLVTEIHVGKESIRDRSKKHSGERLAGQKLSAEAQHQSFALRSDYGETIDWVKAGFVSPVQDQGNCGAGWAFTAVAAVESALAI